METAEMNLREEDDTGKIGGILDMCKEAWGPTWRWQAFDYFGKAFAQGEQGNDHIGLINDIPQPHTRYDDAGKIVETKYENWPAKLATTHTTVVAQYLATAANCAPQLIELLASALSGLKAVGDDLHKGDVEGAKRNVLGHLSSVLTDIGELPVANAFALREGGFKEIALRHWSKGKNV